MVLVAILLILGLTSVTDRMRSSYERKSGSGSASSKGQGQLQFTSGHLSPAQSLELLRPQSSTTAVVGSRSGSAERGSGEAASGGGKSQLLQSDRAR